MRQPSICRTLYSEGCVKKETIQTWKQNAIRHAKAFFGISTFVIAVVSLLIVSQGEDWRIKYIELCLLNAAYLVVVFYLVWIIVTRPSPDFLGMPRVVKLMRSDRLLLVDHSPWISLGVMTTIYIVEDDVERLVCVGEVVNVQDNDLVQISLSQHDRGLDAEDDIWSALERTERRSILVKPRLYPGGS